MKKPLIEKNVIILMMILFLCTSCKEDEQDPQHMNEETRKSAQTLTEVLNHIDKNFITKIDESQFIEQCLKKSLPLIDPHTRYLNPEEYKRTLDEANGEYGGIGVDVKKHIKGLEIISILKESPAEKEDLKMGDIITHIDGMPLVGLTYSEMCKLFNGIVGSTVRIFIERHFNPFKELQIIRSKIAKEMISAFSDHHIGYIEINNFNNLTTSKLYKFLNQFKKDKIQGLIVDLRDNPGGSLEQAVSCAGYFVGKKKIVTIKGQTSDDIVEYESSEKIVFKNIPTIVLINKNSASAAEIVAAAIKDHKKGILFGTKTYGKGSVQTLFPLSNGGGLNLTTALFYSPAQNLIDKKGITPDYMIPFADHKHDYEQNIKEDPTYLKAKDFLQGLLHFQNKK